MFIEGTNDYYMDWSHMEEYHMGDMVVIHKDDPREFVAYFDSVWYEFENEDAEDAKRATETYFNIMNASGKTLGQFFPRMVELYKDHRPNFQFREVQEEIHNV